jgi:hypothetical protein
MYKKGCVTPVDKHFSSVVFVFCELHLHKLFTLVKLRSARVLRLHEVAEADPHAEYALDRVVKLVSTSALSMEAKKQAGPMRTRKLVVY